MASRRAERAGPLAMIWCCLLSAVAVGRDPAQKFLPVDGVELQPLVAATDRLVEALAIIGSPLPAATTDAARFVGRVLRGEVPTVPEP